MSSHFIIILIIFLGIWGFVSKRKHLLNILLSLEFIALNIFMLVGLLLVPQTGASFLIYFLIIVVCEGAVGLSLLVCLVRVHGNDIVGSIRLHR